MRPWMRWLGYSALALVGVVALGIGAVYGLSEARYRKEYQVPAMPLDTPSVPLGELLARGEHIVATRGCNDCHATDLGGRTFIESPALGVLYASNLTGGAGGVASRYTDQELARAIRNGIRHDGRPLLLMPSQEYNPLGDEDVAAVVAYLRSLPPVDREPRQSRPGPLARVLHLAGLLLLVSAEVIDHGRERGPTPAAGATVEYGEYLAVTCTGCHGAGFSGGKIPGTPPEFLPPANLTPHLETGLGRWTEADFVRLVREGVRPDGSMVNTEAMPIAMTSRFTDEELSAIWMYLRTLPPRAYGGR